MQRIGRLAAETSLGHLARAWFAPMGEEVRAAAASLSEALERAVSEADSRSEEVKRMREELEDEKKMMSCLPSNKDAGAEVVEINVGGEIFTTRRSTLLSAEGSLLAAMFSGRWEESLDRDKDGRVFLDLDPAPFRELLSFLRLRLIKPGKPRRPSVRPEHAEMFDAMVDFLGLTDLTGLTTCPSDAALVCAQGCCKDGSVAVNGGTISTSYAGYRAVVGATTLVDAKGSSDTSVAWRVTLNKLARGEWVFAGIITEPTPKSNSYSDCTCYGWSSWQSEVFTAGSASATGVDLQEGDDLLFLLDASRQKLRMALKRTGEIRDIQLQGGVAEKARLHLNLRKPGTEVTVSKASFAELATAGL